MVFRHWTAGAQDSAPKRERRGEGRADTACCPQLPGSWNSCEGGTGRSCWSLWYGGEELAVPQARGLQRLPGRARERRAAERVPDAEESQSLGQRHNHWGSHRPGQDVFPAVSHWQMTGSRPPQAPGPAKQSFRANPQDQTVFR